MKIRFRCPHCDAKCRTEEVLVGNPITCPKCGRDFGVPDVGAGAFREKPLGYEPQEPTDSVPPTEPMSPVEAEFSEEPTTPMVGNVEAMAEAPEQLEYVDEEPVSRHGQISTAAIPQVWEGGPPTEEQVLKARRHRKTFVLDIRMVALYTFAAGLVVFGGIGVYRNFFLEPTFAGYVYIFDSAGEKVGLSEVQVHYVPATDEGDEAVRAYESELGRTYDSVAGRNVPAATGSSIFAVGDQLGKYMGKQAADSGKIALAYHGSLGIAGMIEKTLSTVSTTTDESGGYRLENLPNTDGFLWCRVETDRHFLVWIHRIKRGMDKKRCVNMSPNNAKFVLLLSETSFFRQGSKPPTAGGGGVGGRRQGLGL